MRKRIVAQGTGQRGCLGPDVKKILSLLYTHTFFKKLIVNEKIYNRAKELYCDATIFVFRFFIVYLHKKKWRLKNGPRLPTLPYY